MAFSYKDDNPFQAFVNNVLPYINDIIHEIVKKGLDKILGRLYEV